jgi:hypothetical protein
MFQPVCRWTGNEVAAALFRLACLIAVFSLVFDSAGCSYALPAFKPQSAERVRVLARSPELLVVRVDAGRLVEYPVPADGRLVLGIPGYRRGCSVYLFNAVKVNDGADPLKDWSLTVSFGGRALRKLSLRQVSHLATDSEGFRQLKVGD